MRGIVFLMMLALFCLPVLANQTDEGVLPFAYVIENFDRDENSNFDLYLMDANSGNLLFSVETSEYDCPIGFSPDKQWFLYNQNPGTMPLTVFIRNMQTGESRELGVGGIDFYDWSDDSRRLAYEDERTSSLNIYDTIAQESEVIAQGNFLEARFVGDALLYTQFEDGWISLYRWDGEENQLIQTILEEYTYVYYDHSISPSGRYISLRQETFLYILDTQTGEYQLIADTSYSHVVAAWIPSPEGEMLAYTRSTGMYQRKIFLYETFSQESREFSHTSQGWGLMSPNSDARYALAYEYEPGGTLNEANRLWLFNLETGETGDIAGRIHTGAAGAQWLSEHVFVYGYSPSEQAWASTDLYVYDIRSQERTQLTSSADVNEQFGCIWG